MIEKNLNKDSSDRFLNEEILSEKEKMENIRLPSIVIHMYWGFDLSPPHSTYPNYLSK